ncbi:hypothetical protein [Providencia alcalifaciens]|uniref:hypothetical protein n=1 Tax=Providencia alcalifaciens TaxID=126385 RepID=UPI002B0588A2|nr:hypothetical protein [Providencia alcalifaciens]
MFEHELGRAVQVTISGEKGHIKARAEYSSGTNQYLIHYLTADGRGLDGWFEEGELSLADDSNCKEGRSGHLVSECDGLRRAGHHRYSEANYVGRNIPQLRQLLKEVTEEYMVNRDIEWFSQQSRLINDATQAAYKRGAY